MINKLTQYFLFQIEAIAAYLSNQTDYDLIALQDLWMRPDHETIRSKLSKGKRLSKGHQMCVCLPQLCPSSLHYDHRGLPGLGGQIKRHSTRHPNSTGLENKEI